jgi:hypothetical protein
LNAYYLKRFATIGDPVPESERALRDLSQKLPEILRYHRVALLPEDRPPEPNDLDLKRIRKLKEHHERLTGTVAAIAIRSRFPGGARRRWPE